jgi:hypothetical protein
MPVRYFQRGGFVVDVTNLLSSRFKRWVAQMDVREIERHHRGVHDHDDVTGDVVIIGGLGVVDGFRALDKRKSGKISVIIFELRNAERYIYHEIGPGEKEGGCTFKPDTIIGQLRNRVDLEGWEE